MIKPYKSQHTGGRAGAPGVAAAQAAVGQKAGLDLMKVLECHSWDVGMGVEFLE